MGLFGKLFGKKDEKPTVELNVAGTTFKIEIDPDKLNKSDPIEDARFELIKTLNNMDHKVGGYIEKIMHNIAPTYENPTGYTHVGDRIKYIDEMINAYDELMKAAKQDQERYDFYDHIWNHENSDGIGLIQMYRNLREELVSKKDEIESAEKERDESLIGLKNRLLTTINDNEGIVQSEMIKMFPECIKNDIRDYIYHMEKEGLVTREKSGRSYILHTK